MTTILQSQPTPKMLKDFLLQDNTQILTHTHSSSTGFKSYPRTQPEPDYHPGPNPAPGCVTTLPRSRSKSRAAAEALGKLITNAVKGFHSSTPLPLRNSRRFLGMGMMRKWRSKKKEKVKCSGEVTNSAIVVVTVKVKDILRWRSFRDLMVDDGNNHVHHVVDNEDGRVWEEVEELQPLDCDVGPSDEAPKDFTVSEGEKWDEVSDDGVASDTYVGSKKDNQNLANEEEIEQQSPVSVFESPFREEVSDEEFPSSFDQSLANMERTKQRLLQSIQLFESLAGVNKDYELEEDEEEEEKECILTEEENTNEVTKSKGYLSRGSSWFSRGEKGLEEKKECIKVMDEQRHWGKFEDERVDLGVDLEVVVLNQLLDEVLIDFCY